MISFLDREEFKAGYIGICFMFLFASTTTLGYIQKSIMTNITEEKPAYDIDGYISLALGYFIFSFSTLICPFWVMTIKPKIVFIVCSLANIFHPLSFLIEISWVTYMSIVIHNIALSMHWVAHGNYIISISSSKVKISRNIGIFWFFYSWSIAVGNVYAIIRLNDQARLDKKARISVLTAISLISCVGFTLCLFIRSTETGPKAQIKKRTLIKTMKTTWHLLWTKPMLLLLFTFSYMGFEQVFSQSMMGPSIGFSHQFGTIATQLIPISGMCYALGQVSGAVIQMIIGKQVATLKYGRKVMILLGFVTQATASVLLAVSLPNNSVFGNTNDKAIISTKYGLALSLIAAFMEALGDSIYTNQLYPVFDEVEPNEVSHAVAIYKFFKTFTSFIYLSVITKTGLQPQMSLTVVIGGVSMMTFAIVDTWMRQKHSEKKPESIK